MLLPLHCYDEAGRVKPPLWLYWMLILLCSDWLALVFSLLTFGKTSELLSLFYPDRSQLGMRLLATLPFVVTLLLLGNRERLWKRGWTEWRKLIYPLLMMGVVMSILAQVLPMGQDHWAFHWTPAAFLLANLILALTALQSIHLKTLYADWRYREPESAKLAQADVTEPAGQGPVQNRAQR
ncbi:DUF2919 family protein [Alteromonas confluentis]|uniref:DUF2919 family protein n=1 Tax=Alteromonas confluentis TaxID=1656094 RepID=UPI0009F47CC4|nr:DUF2919 family protein [Alteromonas confluentis]